MWVSLLRDRPFASEIDRNYKDGGALRWRTEIRNCLGLPIICFQLIIYSGNYLHTGIGCPLQNINVRHSKPNL